MGGTRPARSAAKKGASKINAMKAKTSASKGSDFDMDEDDFDPATVEDDDDSDEYVEPTTGKDGRDEDDEDEDDEDRMDIDEEQDEGQESKQKSRRRRKLHSTFTIPVDEMHRLLDSSHRSEALADDSNMITNATGAEINLEPLGGAEVVYANKAVRYKPIAEPGKRAPRKQPTKQMHKKGEMNNPNSLPPTWRFSYQGPTSEDVGHVSMQQEALQSTVYPNVTSNIKDFRVLTEPSELDEYFPVLTTTKINTRGRGIDMRTMTAQYIDTTKEVGINDYYILNTGFSVWAMDWCPLPSHREKSKNMDYVAIGGFPDTAENCIARDQLYPLGKQDAHPNMIQIWSMNCNTNDQGELQGKSRASLDMCILHSYGAVIDMKWCPTGSLMDAGSSNGDLTRLGILAAAFSDGSVRIFSVPEPNSLREHLNIVTPGDSIPEPVYLEYPEPYVTIRMNDINFMCINWGTSERLAAGLSNGTIGVWDMKLMLSQTKETLAEKDSEYLDPIFLPQVHDVSVRCVDWIRDVNALTVPWILTSSGYDGRIKYTDLHDVYSQIDVKTFLGVSMASIFNSWGEAIIYTDFDYGGKMDQLYLESRGFRLFNAKGTIWDFSSSDYQPFIAAAISDGRVKIANPVYKARRGYGMVQVTLYQLEEVTEDADKTSKENHAMPSDPMDDEEDTKIASFQYKEGEEREYISKSSGYLSFYGANVAVQKVQWSRCYHSAAWLASGTAGGLVRIDNTMLRQEESGKGNKLTYQAEPYRLKKQMAKGGSFGPNGEYIPPKKGRPRKDKGKNAKETTTKAKTTCKGSKSKKKMDDYDSEEEPEAEESGHDSDVDDQILEGQSSISRFLRDDDDFVSPIVDAGSSNNSEKRTTRLSAGRLAPIFTRVASKNAAAEEDQDVSVEDEGEDVGVSSSSKASTEKTSRAAATSLPPKKNSQATSIKPRRKPRKDVNVDPMASNQTLLSMMTVSSQSEHAESSLVASQDATAGDVEMTDAAEESTAAPLPSASSAAAALSSETSTADNVVRKKPRGRPPKARPMEAKTTPTVVSNDVASMQDSSHGAATELTRDNSEKEISGENLATQSSESVPSSRASSVAPETTGAESKAPATSGKRRMTKKRIEEEKKKASNRKLTDLWGNSSKNAKEAKAKP
ncbi:hypothetical protein FBU30_008766 [Linnemannia zychae]|nr:hypothetical protein FBU30_008766 [Linnemannia zychae]